MDYQITNHRKDAAKRLNCFEDELLYYAFPKAFASTSGPFGGMGGQAISTFTIECLYNNRDAVLYCGDKFWKKVEKFNFLEEI